MIFTKLSPKQLKSMLWWGQKDTKDYDAIVCDGSVRSGKTMSMTIGFVLWSGRVFDGENFAFCGKTIDSLKRNVITPLQKWLGGIVKFKINLSKNYMDITVATHTNRYYMFGGKDESSYQLIQGITLAGVLFDEVALMPKSFVDQALARCSVSGSRFWFNCNPESSEHWFYKEWILKNDEKNALHLHFTMEDNFSLSDEVKKRYERSFSGVFYDRYIKGLWVLAEGLVYPMFDKAKHTLHTYTPPSDARYYISCDYGTVNPFSAGLWVLEKSRAVRLKEYYWDGHSKARRTDEEHYKALERLAEGYKIDRIIVDPSASSFIECIIRHGKFNVVHARNDVIQGVERTATLMQNDRIFICENCEDLIRELGLYRWDEKSGKDKVIKENDHACDDMRYFVNTILPAKLLRNLYQKGGDKI